MPVRHRITLPMADSRSFRLGTTRNTTGYLELKDALPLENGAVLHADRRDSFGRAEDVGVFGSTGIRVGADGDFFLTITRRTAVS